MNVSGVGHTLRDEARLRLHSAPDKALIVQPCDCDPDLPVSRRFLELDRHIQMAIGAEGAGRLRRDVEEDVVSGRPYRGRGVVECGANNETRRGRVGPESHGRALGVAGNIIHPFHVRCNMLLCSVQRPGQQYRVSDLPIKVVFKSPATSLSALVTEEWAKVFILGVELTNQVT